MAIQIMFDSANNVKSPTMVLSYRSGKSIGSILPHNLHYSESLNSCNEMSFDVYKETDGVQCQYWSKINDFKLMSNLKKELQAISQNISYYERKIVSSILFKVILNGQNIDLQLQLVNLINDIELEDYYREVLHKELENDGECW